MAAKAADIRTVQAYKCPGKEASAINVIVRKAPRIKYHWHVMPCFSIEGADSDIRGLSPDWLAYFKDGKPSSDLVTKISQIREILTSNERSLVQGALAWLWAQSPNNIPIPGFRNRTQVQGLIQSLDKGPLSQQQMSEIITILKSTGT